MTNVCIGMERYMSDEMLVYYKENEIFKNIKLGYKWILEVGVLF